MKKIDLILRGKKLVDKLFDLRRKKINRVLDSAKDNVEKQIVEAELRYEELFGILGDDGVNYEGVINNMIAHKELIENAKATQAAISAIEADLNKEVDEAGNQ